ncbi:MAG: hypothetical protein ABIO91_00610 [Pyrinomonadaceae bacterium]
MHLDSAIKIKTPDTRTICQLHAVLVRVFDVGVLMVGESGSGKSECALELIRLGHRLIADDAVEVFLLDGRLAGRAPRVTRHLINIRSLGIMNVFEIFGKTAVCESSAIDICIELKKPAEVESMDTSVAEYKIAGARLPTFLLPVSPERNLAALVETTVCVYRGGISFKTTGSFEHHSGSRHPVH